MGSRLCVCTQTEAPKAPLCPGCLPERGASEAHQGALQFGQLKPVNKQSVHNQEQAHQINQTSAM